MPFWSVEVPGRLVGQQQFGRGDQRPGDGGPLHFAAREFTRFVAQTMGQADHVQQLAGSCRVGTACSANNASSLPRS